MNLLKSLFLLVVVVLSMHACKQPVDKNLLFGEWRGVDWRIEGQEAEYDAASTTFSFDTSGRYVYRYGDFEEGGEYSVVSDELFTTPDGGMKMMVKISTLTPDSLVMHMNRGGTSETLKLVRE